MSAWWAAETDFAGPTQVAIDEGQQVALGMFVVELFDDLRRQFLRQPFVEARTGRQALQAAVLDVLGNQRPLVPAELHCLEGDQQDVQRHFQLRHVHPHARKRKDRGQHVGLLGVDLIGKLLACCKAQTLKVEHGLHKNLLRNGCHITAWRCGIDPSAWGCQQSAASTSEA